MIIMGGRCIPDGYQVEVAIPKLAMMQLIVRSKRGKEIAAHMRSWRAPIDDYT
jgi:hypothetical protein